MPPPILIMNLFSATKRFTATKQRDKRLGPGCLGVSGGGGGGVSLHMRARRSSLMLTFMAFLSLSALRHAVSGEENIELSDSCSPSCLITSDAAAASEAS